MIVRPSGRRSAVSVAYIEDKNRHMSEVSQVEHQKPVFFYTFFY